MASNKLKAQREPTAEENEQAFEKNWQKPCMNCGQKPTVGTTRLCGPCCFGEADTAGGNW
jgi:hypothetical protein